YVSRRDATRLDSEWDVCRASPEDGPPTRLTTIPGARFPLSPLFVKPMLSPDEQWLAWPLADGSTTNIWIYPTSGGGLRAVTEFGDRSTMIARQVSWAPDSRSIFAAVADTRTDVVVLDGLV